MTRLMRGRLFIKIYATVLACLVLAAIATAAFVRLSQADDDRGWAGRRDAFITAMLPDGGSPDQLQATLERLGPALGADITLFDPAGRVVASVGEPAPPHVLKHVEDRRWFRRPFRFTTRLPDGRVVAARMDAPFGPGRHGGALAYIALITVVAAAAAYPVVRHLTRRLERLRGGVEAWGGGDMARRVAIDGKDEIAAVAAAFNKAAATVERLIRSHRSLLANASHELRSPLARLRLASDLHAASPTEATREEIARGLDELDALVEEILLASRLDHDVASRGDEEVDLLAVAAEEGARHDVAVSGEPATMRGDPHLLARMVRNLIQNAERHGAPPIEIEVRRRGAATELSVRDHGPGVPEGEAGRIFEPFYRPSGHGETSGGWGLGLALVRQIAERHGAAVRLETPPDGGARFVVAFGA